MRETEIKILEVDRVKIEKRLLEIGAEFQFTKEIVAILLDDASERIRSQGNVLRLRKKGDINVLTFKHLISKESAKIMQEYEVQVGDFEAMRAILGKLGFFETLQLRKTRTEYRFGQVKIVFDKYHDRLSHIPEFLEIETEELGLIYDFIPLIDYQPGDCKPWGLQELIHHYMV